MSQHSRSSSVKVVVTEKHVADIKRRLEMYPIELEPRIATLDKPLIIECACPGAQPVLWGPPELYPFKPPGYEEGGVRFGAVPVSLEDQIAEDVEAIQAGAVALQHDPRDPETGLCTTQGPQQASMQAEIYSGVFHQVDAIPLETTYKRAPDGSADYVSLAQELLDLGRGNRYCQGAVVMWPPGNSYPPNYAKSVQETIRYMETHNIKPIHKLRSSYHVRQLERLLIDTGVMTRKPFVLVHDMGHPFGWPMDMEPWMPIELITSIMQTKQRIPDSVIGVYSGGRNWLPTTMTAIIAGVDIVRTGIEDIYWMYPHRDDVVQRNVDTVRKIVEFCQLIGRPVATVPPGAPDSRDRA